jgi:hypothetical protein
MNEQTRDRLRKHPADNFVLCSESSSKTCTGESEDHDALAERIVQPGAMPPARLAKATWIASGQSIT